MVWAVEGKDRMRTRHFLRAHLVFALAVVASGLALAGDVAAETEIDPDVVNARLYQQLAPPAGSGRIETVSGQMYLSQENIDAEVIGEALAAMRELQQGRAESVAIQRAPRLNFEIHFPKNSARLTDASRQSLDELARALSVDDYAAMRFVLGGHTDQDGDETVNQPLSEARAATARDYLVEQHAIDAARLVARGYGAAEPLREVEETEQDKRYNRRVDLRPLR